MKMVYENNVRNQNSETTCSLEFNYNSAQLSSSHFENGFLSDNNDLERDYLCHI